MNDFADTEISLYRLHAQGFLTKNWKIVSDITHEDTRADAQVSFRNSPATAPSRLEREQTMFSPKVVGVLNAGNQKIDVTVGVDVEKVDYLGTRGTESERDNHEAYFQVSIPLNNYAVLTTGVRHTDYEDKILTGAGEVSEGHLTSGSLGLLMHANDHFSLYARVDENYRLASVDEFTFIETSATRLNPQSGYSFEAGARYQKDNTELSVNLFRLDLNDEIIFDSTADGPWGPSSGANVNLDDTRRWGLEIQYAQSITSYLSTELSYSYIDARFKSGTFKDNTVFGVPDQTAKMGLKFYPVRDMSVDWNAHYIGNAFLSGDNANAQAQRGGYTVHHLSVRYEQAENLAYRMSVHNIGNKLYSENANQYGSRNPSPERHFFASVQYKF